MIHAYPEMYLNRAMTNLGDAFDYAINDCNIPGEKFMDIFCLSSACIKLENGEPKYLLGMSGIELAKECIEERTNTKVDIIPRVNYNRTSEYWCGWAICFYQWLSGRKYAEIFRHVTYRDLIVMYKTLHEADVAKFAHILETKIKAACEKTRLKTYREARGCSQSSLSKLSGVSLRSIQMYEQKQKDINKASAVTLLQLSKALGCKMEDLLELSNESA